MNDGEHLIESLLIYSNVHRNITINTHITMLRKWSNILLCSFEFYNQSVSYKLLLVLKRFSKFSCIFKIKSPKIPIIIAEEILSYFEIVVYCGLLLDVTEGSYTSQDPVVRALHSLEEDEGYVVQVCSRWFLVDRALVESGITSSRLYCVHMHNRQRSVQHLQLMDFVDTEVIMKIKFRSKQEYPRNEVKIAK